MAGHFSLVEGFSLNLFWWLDLVSAFLCLLIIFIFLVIINHPEVGLDPGFLGEVQVVLGSREEGLFGEYLVELLLVNPFLCVGTVHYIHPHFLLLLLAELLLEIRVRIEFHLFEDMLLFLVLPLLLLRLQLLNLLLLVLPGLDVLQDLLFLEHQVLHDALLAVKMAYTLFITLSLIKFHRGRSTSGQLPPTSTGCTSQRVSGNLVRFWPPGTPMTLLTFSSLRR